MSDSRVRSRKDIFRSINPGPRARTAARLYASGAVPTKRAACEAVGLSPTYLSVLDASGNPVTTRIQDDIEQALADQTVALSRGIALISREALTRVRELMKSGNEHVALKASSDILDRNPETSKTFKATITSFSLDPADARELAASLVAAAKIKQQFSSVADGDFVKVEVDANGTANGNGKTSPEEHHGTLKNQEAARIADRTASGQATQGEEKELRLLKPGG